MFLTVYFIVVECLERLGYCTESRRKALRSNPGFAIRRLKMSIFFESVKDKEVERRGIVSSFHLLIRYSWSLTPTALALFSHRKYQPLIHCHSTYCVIFVCHRDEIWFMNSRQNVHYVAERQNGHNGCILFILPVLL